MRRVFPLLLVAACAGGETAGGDTVAGSDSIAAAPASGSGTGAVGDTVAPTDGSGTGVTDGLCVGEGPSVTGGRVGAVRLGMTADELRRTCNATDTTFTLGEGIREHGIATRVGGASVVAVLGAGDTVTRILVREAGLLTDRGIGVTSNVGAVRARYPEMCALTGEGTILVASPAGPGISFVTTADFGRLANAAASAIPDSASVKGIWVHGVERVCPG